MSVGLLEMFYANLFQQVGPFHDVYDQIDIRSTGLPALSADQVERSYWKRITFFAPKDRGLLETQISHCLIVQIEPQ